MSQRHLPARAPGPQPAALLEDSHLPEPYPEEDPITGARALPAAAAAALLAEVVDRAAAAVGPALIAFDLDSTVLDNRPRQAFILREYGAAHGVPAFTRCQAAHWTSWDARAAMAAAGATPEEIERHHASYLDYWRTRFFTSAYCAIDVPVPGAAAYLGALAGSGAALFYVTGRHEGMRAGTVESFDRAGFPRPDGAGVQLLMKPTEELSDDDFKAEAFAVLRQGGAVLAAFDNEPTHINAYHGAFPGARCVHLARDHSMRPVRVRPAIPSIRNFLAFRSA
jgi:hypothetical protein